jgi:hypothetical protein
MKKLSEWDIEQKELKRTSGSFRSTPKNRKQAMSRELESWISLPVRRYNGR